MKPRFPSLMFALASIGCLAGGCASTPLPREFDRTSVRIVAGSTVPKLDVSGVPGGKPGGAGIGAGTGGGIGVVASVAACAAAGPLVGVCLATLLPAATAVGVVAGGAVGAVRTESSESMALKTHALTDEFAGPRHQERLSRRVQEQSGIASSPEAGGADAKVWTLEVGIAEVGTEGGSEFAVRLVTYAQLRHDGAAPIWQIKKEVQSETQLTTSQWLAEDSKALHSVLDDCIEQAASQFAVELAKGRADSTGNEGPGTKYSTSCHDQRPPQVAPMATPREQALATR